MNESKIRMPRQYLQKWVMACIKETKKQVGVIFEAREITLVFMDPKPAQALNLKYRKRNYATDVLSFDGDKKHSLGELLLCPQVIKKQAKEHGLTFREELGYMVLHGYLHLLGYDHEQDAEKAREMFHLQDLIFDKLCRKF